MRLAQFSERWGPSLDFVPCEPAIVHDLLSHTGFLVHAAQVVVQPHPAVLDLDHLDTSPSCMNFLGFQIS